MKLSKIFLICTLVLMALGVLLAMTEIVAGRGLFIIFFLICCSYLASRSFKVREAGVRPSEESPEETDATLEEHCKKQLLEQLRAEPESTLDDEITGYDFGQNRVLTRRQLIAEIEAESDIGRSQIAKMMQIERIRRL